MRNTRAVEPITVVDLFAGCGGFTQGFHEFRPAGFNGTGSVFRSITAVEHDKAAAATYAANFGSLRIGATPKAAARVHVGDIKHWEPEEADVGADVVVGGPPCQGFSALNRAKAGLERNSLWFEFVTAVSRIKPKLFVIENVDRFLKSAEFDDLLDEVKGDGLLKDYRLVNPLGDSVDETVLMASPGRFLLNSADYGAVQARRRAIVIGVRRDFASGDAMHYPRKTHFARLPGTSSSIGPGLFESGEAQPWLSVAGVFKESGELKIEGTELPERTVFFPDAEATVPGVFTTVDLHFGRNPVPLSLARYRAIQPGGNRNDLRDQWYTMTKDGAIKLHDRPPRGHHFAQGYLSTPSWDKHRSGAGDVMGRIKPNQPSVTIRTEFFKPEKGRYLHPEDDRPITHYEAARIQGFPVEFRWCGSKMQIARQIGNAVPVPLGTAIAGAIYAFLRN